MVISMKAVNQAANVMADNPGLHLRNKIERSSYSYDRAMCVNPVLCPNKKGKGKV